MALGLIIQRRSYFPPGGWPECSGMGGRNQSECPAGMDRNRWPELIGISGRNASEYANAWHLHPQNRNRLVNSSGLTPFPLCLVCRVYVGFLVNLLSHL